MKETEEVIRALSTVFDSKSTSQEVRRYTAQLIQALVKDYEEQSKGKYEGFLPGSVRGRR